MDGEQELPEADVSLVVHVVVRKEILTDGARVAQREEEVEPGHTEYIRTNPDLIGSENKLGS